MVIEIATPLAWIVQGPVGLCVPIEERQVVFDHVNYSFAYPETY